MHTGTRLEAIARKRRIPVTSLLRHTPGTTRCIRVHLHLITNSPMPELSALGSGAAIRSIIRTRRESIEILKKMSRLGLLLV